MFSYRVLCLLASIALLTTGSAWAVVESQTFDDATSTASAGWAGHMNTPADGMGVDLDFRNSNYAGGDAGEGGGFIPSRTDEHAYYADLTLADNPTLADIITASGKIVFPSISSGFDGGFDFGFFDSTNLVRVTSGGAVGGLHDFLGVRFPEVGGSTTELRWWPLMANTAGTTSTRIQTGTQYLFDISYDPNGAGAGLGKLTVDFQNAVTMESLGPQSITYPSMGQSLNLNSFGFLTLDFDTNFPTAEVYIDNLEYGNQDAPVLAFIETQSFDDAASAAAAGWTGLNNTPGDGFGVDLDFRNSALAGGTAGEAGGAMPTRTAEIAYYADTTLGGSLTEGDVLTASGRFTADSFAGVLDGGFELGFFNSTDLTIRPSSPGVGGVEDAMAIRFLDGGDTQLRFGARAGSAGEVQSSGRLDVGADYLFELIYDPNGSGEGMGSLTANFRRADDNGLVGSATVTGIPSTGGTMDLNAFGLVSLDFNSEKPAANVYIDDLSYTVVPEPSALVLLVLTLGMLLLPLRIKKNCRG